MPVKHFLHSLHGACLIAVFAAAAPEALCARPKAVAELSEDGVAKHDAKLPTREEVKAAGALRSSFLNHQARPAGSESLQPKLEVFRKKIAPILRKACSKGHGVEKQKAHP